MSPYRCSTFAFLFVQLCSYMESVVHFDRFISINPKPCHHTLCNVSICCVQLCCYMGKVFHFDSFRFMNPKSCRHTGVLCCFMVCTVVYLYCEKWPFDGFSCSMHLESRPYQLCLTLFCFEAEVSCPTLKYMYKYKLSKSSFSLPYCKLMGTEI